MNFINYLDLVDIIFLAAIVTFIILIVTLIYFVKINKDVLGEDDFFPPNDSNNKKEENIMKSEEIPSEVKDTEKKQEDEKMNELEYNDEEGELIDLETLTKKLKAEKNDEELAISKYEQDQEEKAIISYDELLEKHNRYAINYEKEEVIDNDLVIKKVNLNDLINKNEEEQSIAVRVISYEKEEAFLTALKELNRLLN